LKNKIKYLTLYAFSTENWKRPKKEINYRVEQWNRFPTIKAIKDKRIHFIGEDYILIPGPRLVKILEKFTKIIHPDLSHSQVDKNSFQDNLKP